MFKQSNNNCQRLISTSSYRHKNFASTKLQTVKLQRVIRKCRDNERICLFDERSRPVRDALELVPVGFGEIVRRGQERFGHTIEETDTT